MTRSAQRGATLVVGLIILVVLTVLGISAASLSGSDLLMVFNRQVRQDVESVGQLAIEQVMSSVDNFTSPTATVAAANTGGMNVTIADRVCVRRITATGYSLKSMVTPEDTNWDVAVTVTDPVTGAATTMHQGVKVRMLGGAGSCP